MMYQAIRLTYDAQEYDRRATSKNYTQLSVNFFIALSPSLLKVIYIPNILIKNQAQK